MSDPKKCTELGATPSGVGEVRLSLCMIVRDSAKTLPACLKSIRPWVDEMVIVDTGSVDNTPEIVEQFGGALFHFPWCDDFSAARNESLRHARGQWLFWMDSDDTISPECGRQLRTLADGSHDENTLGYVMQVHCPGERGSLDYTAVDHVKMFRNGRGIQFECRIHEQVLMAIRRLNGEVAWTDIHVVHSGSDQSSEGRQRKWRRDLHLLELELQDHPDHPFTLFNLGMTYNDMGNHAEAVNALERSLQASKWAESHVPKATALLMHSLTQLNRHDNARQQCLAALQHYPEDAELHFRLAIIEHHLGRLPEAVNANRAAMRNSGPRQFSSVDRGIFGYKARHNLALIYQEMGRHDLAELQWREAIREAPDFRPAWHGLGTVLLHQNKIETARVEFDQLGDQPDLLPERELVRAKIYERTGALVEAGDALTRALDRFPREFVLHQALARVLFEQRDWKQATVALENLARLTPDDGAAHYNLGLARLHSQDPNGAVAALTRALELRPASELTRTALAQAEQAQHDE